jgi:hypothetical protein
MPLSQISHLAHVSTLVCSRVTLKKMESASQPIYFFDDGAPLPRLKEKEKILEKSGPMNFTPPPSQSKDGAEKILHTFRGFETAK